MQWNGTKWENLGQVVDPPTPPPSQAISQASTTTTTTTKKKMVHEGIEYDYVFQIDVSDDSPPLPLPYNLEGASSVSLASFSSTSTLKLTMKSMGQTTCTKLRNDSSWRINFQNHTSNKSLVSYASTRLEVKLF